MLPKLKPVQRVFIEITNPIHGGVGSDWELGKRLWSPLYDSGNNEKWKIMRQIRIDDIILHLVKVDGVDYQVTGMSVVNSNHKITKEAPPVPGDWGGKSHYQYILLSNYSEFGSSLLTDDFFTTYKEDLKQIREKNDAEGNFFAYISKRDSLEVAEKYLAECNDDTYDLLSQYLSSKGIDYSESNDLEIPTSNEPGYPDKKPNRKFMRVSRLIRDTALSRRIKIKYKWVCQVCGGRIKLPDGNFYAEGHHIQPLGKGHDGLDVEDNIIILCPTHHAEFDYGCIAIDPESNKIVHVDNNNHFHNKEPNYPRKNIRKTFIQYHFNAIFGKTFRDQINP
jgi:hypothetical protein